MRIAIVGGGASGMAAAIAAAGCEAADITLYEKNDRVGKKLLLTGNGRCNFTNNNLGKEYYFSNSNLDFICDNHDEFLEFLMEIGVFYKDLDGYYYPITNQSKTVSQRPSSIKTRIKTTAC